MGIVAVGTQEVLLLSVPVAGPPAVNTRSPISQLGAMTLAAQLIGFLEIDQFPAGRVQHVPIVGVMTIHAPPIFFIVLENDIIMEIFQLPSLEVNIQVGMTFRTGKHILAEGGRRNLDIHLVFAGGLLSFFSRAGRLVAGHKQREKKQQYKYRSEKTRFKHYFSHFQNPLKFISAFSN
jgi:hypothetical protein